MKKHAYLIMAHNNFQILKYLMMSIDDERNDIYLHVDAKNKCFNQDKCKSWIKKSEVYFIERNRVYWADFSQTDVTIQLLEKARGKQNYHYYHLLSGIDMPLKTQDEIHDLLCNSNDEFIGVVPTDKSWYATKHVRFYYFFLNNSVYRKFKPLKLLTRILVELQHLFCVNRIKDDSLVYTDGWTWFSITDSFVEYLLQKKEYIYTTFKKTLASDEIFIQTLAFNSTFKERIHDLSSLSNSSKRYIDWKRGKPYTFRSSDFDELISSNCFFARKFDESIDIDVVKKIYTYLENKKKESINE